MLGSATRVGPSRQTLLKGFVIRGADPVRLDVASIERSLPLIGGRPPKLSYDSQTRMWHLGADLLWLGTRAARDAAFDDFAAAFQALGAHVPGGRVLPPGLALDGGAPIVGGDVHRIEVLDATEQEVVCNLLRIHTPALIVMSGRGAVAPGRPADRVGSRWLAQSQNHLAARYLASTSTTHLGRVARHIRRTDGVANIERLDVVPVRAIDGVLFVEVRCVDAAASLATARALAIVLAAISLEARRLVRGGRRVPPFAPRVLERNRARAISLGRRARFERDDGAQPRRGDPRQGKNSDTVPLVPAADFVRDLVRFGALRILKRESDPADRMRRQHGTQRDGPNGLVNVEAAEDELAAVLLPLDLPTLDPSAPSTDDQILAAAARGGAATLIERAADLLVAGAAGGELLTVVRRGHGPLTTVVLGAYHDTLTGERRDASQSERPAGAGGRSGGGGNTSAGARRPGSPARGGERAGGERQQDRRGGADRSDRRDRSARNRGGWSGASGSRAAGSGGGQPPRNGERRQGDRRAGAAPNAAGDVGDQRQPPPRRGPRRASSDGHDQQREDRG